ncbi:ATP12 family chaperone protein [Rhizorhabdus wittichii]|uniref:ATPase n=1 Tax=Rhizorhabdus wittichii TaxID=160791 RepID=A0A975D0D2_9SPHN|nr:ATP12 family protein [Rhizorhabdus wittichii]ARR54098.1 ATPase [Rhizorhabdus wittichii DC-6]QTH20544.1 ATPase [Rhizorhabdus wittichii]
MKRFYKQVSVEPVAGGHAIRLDGRPVKTPARADLTLPTSALAHAVAAEWDAQAEEIDPRRMPLTGLANAAIDRIAPDPAAFARGLAAYAETDLLCYRADSPAKLVDRQAASWDPLLDWARDRYDVHFETVAGIIHRPQPDETVQRLAAAVAAHDAFHLAALQPLVTITGSLVIALALAEGRIDAEQAFAAAHLDELWQAEQWGEDALATEARENRRADFKAAARLLGLLV